MAGTKQSLKNAITLKGSTEIVAEFFMYGINSILYQRGIYPPETFSHEDKYGLTLLVSTDEQLKKYLSEVLKQVKDWLYNMTVQKLVVVIKSISTNEVLERWQFDVECDKSVLTDNNNSQTKQKLEQDVNKEIQAVIRQITASVTFLPLLDTACAFDLLVYTDKDLECPEAWAESSPAIISNSQEVRLRSFTTSIHKIDSMVAYKNVTD